MEELSVSKLVSLKRVLLQRPTLILMCGISGTGKTLLAREIARHVSDSFWVEKDLLNDAFLEDRHGSLISNGLLTSDYYHASVKNQTYNYMFRLAKHNLGLGKHPVLEGNYNKQIRDDSLQKVLSTEFDDEICQIKLIYCFASEAEVKRRIVERGATRDLDKVASDDAWSEFLLNQPILPVEDLNRYKHKLIDTSQPIEHCVKQAMGYLLEE